jgi:hypothetical protein
MEKRYGGNDMVEDKYNRDMEQTAALARKPYSEAMAAARKTYCEAIAPAAKAYGEAEVSIEEVAVCQFTGCIRNDLDPVMVAGKQYCYGHSYWMDFIEGGRWEDD